MADPLSVTASVGGLLMLAGKIVSDGLNFVNKVRDCPKEIPMLLQEVSLLNTVLTQLMTLANDSGIPAGAPGGSTLQQYLTPSLVAECNSLLNDVKKAIEKCQQIQGRRGDNVRKSLLWPFKDREVKASIEHLRRLKDHFAAAVAVDTR